MGKGGGSVYNQSANALQSAGGIYGNAAGLYGQSGIYKPALASSPQTANPAAISSGIQGYMSPYTSNVINRGVADINRQRDLQLNQVGADAARVGAFGGSRQGVVEALTNSEAQKNAGDLSATLMDQSFRAAAGLSGQDIANQMATGQFNTGIRAGTSLANQNARNEASQYTGNNLLARAAGLAGIGGAVQGLGTTAFDIGNSINDRQLQQGTLQQQLVQAIMGGAGNQFQQYTGSPQQSLMTRLQALGMNPMQEQTTTTGSYTPGLFDYLSLGAGIYGANQMGRG